MLRHCDISEASGELKRVKPVAEREAEDETADV